MICHPRIGMRVQIWYAEKWRPWAQWHGKSGTVIKRSTGPGPRNHMIEVHNRIVIVPCGNLRKEQEQ
jgi:hypothetical protein